MSYLANRLPTIEYLPPALVARELEMPVNSLHQIRFSGKFLLPNLITNVVQRKPQLGWDRDRVVQWCRTYASEGRYRLRARLPHLSDAPAWWRVPLLVAPSFGDIVGEYEQSDLRRVLRAAAAGTLPAPVGKVKATYAWHLHDAAAVADYAGGSPELNPLVAMAVEDWQLLPGFPEQWQLPQVAVQRAQRAHQFQARVGDPAACTDCDEPIQAHRAAARTPAQQAAQLRAELVAVRAAMKNTCRDVTGLMYENGPDGLRLRDYVASADTNGPPADADTRAWAVRGHLGDLLDWLDAPHPDNKE